MDSSSPAPEALRFGRSQTPESPRPVHLPEPQNIPVLQNQMDPVFNDTSTYNIHPSSLSVSLRSQNGSVSEDNVQEILQPHNQHAPDTSLPGRPSANNGQAAQPHSAPDEMKANLLNAPETASQQTSTDTTIAPLPTSYNTHLIDLTSLISNVNRHDTSDHVVVPFGHEAIPDARERQIRSSADQDTARSQAGVDRSQITNIPNSTANTQALGAAEAVDYQSILNRITGSANAARANESLTAPTTAAPALGQDFSYNSTERPLPPGIGLPPKPPIQARPSALPEYTSESHQAYQSRQHASLASPSRANQTLPSPNNAVSMPIDLSELSQSSVPAANGLPPPPNLQIPQNPWMSAGKEQSPASQIARGEENFSILTPATSATAEERPWGPDVQILYDKFLSDERNYVTEGIWDKFPAGSRLFVGNLPSEKVTKRDLFHVFYRHGRLAQISIKQAYGFVQFLEAASCAIALNAEQGVEIRGRKIHLEISKPQRNTRNSGGGGNKGAARRRSRSPERGGSRGSFGRGNMADRLPFSDFRDEPGRRRDDHRSKRSPSPRAYRGRDDYRPREQSPRGYNRTRTPPFGSGFRPPTPKTFDEDATLPLPRRDPRDVPDVQILVLEDVAPPLVSYLEQGFRSKGLTAQTIFLTPGITLAAVIKRQIIEGVQAVVKVTRNMQFNRKIPLQVFDRTAGASNVNFNEYVDLDVQVAGDVVIQARQKERSHSRTASNALYPLPYNGVQPPYPFPQSPQVQQPYQQQMPQQYHPPQPQQQYPQQQVSSYRGSAQQIPTPTSAGANLQELLANLQQPSGAQQVQSPQIQQPTSHTDLAGLLSNVAARQQNQAHSYQTNQAPQQQPQLDSYGQRASMQSYPSQAGQSYGNGTQQPQENIQSVMEQLARYNR